MAVVGLIDAFIAAVGAIDGIDTYMPAGSLYFDLVPDRSVPPYAVLTDVHSEDLIDTAGFEAGQATNGQQSETYRVTLRFWTRKLVDCEQWATLVENGMDWSSLSVAGYLPMPESVERGRKRFWQDKQRSTQVNIVHGVEIPYVFQVIRQQPVT